MEKHSCKTYFAVKFNFDSQKNAEIIKDRRACAPEEIGIYNKDEVEKFITCEFGVKPEWRRHHFVLGLNEEYNSDVNEMIRVTLKNLFGKEDKIKEMQKKFSITCVLEIVPQISAASNEPHQYLSPDKDIINFLYNSDTAIDLDYYIT